MTKKLLLISLLILAVLPTQKAYGQSSDIGKIIGKNTPEFISKPIISTINRIEKFRLDLHTKSEKRGKEAKDKSLEYYSYKFFSFLLNNKIVFYGILLVLIFLFLRFIIDLIL